MARVAGVAPSSVSRALSGHRDVSAALRARVLAAVEELGYTPDLLAQSLRRQETMTVGFVVGDISNPLMAHIVKGAETTLQQAGYSMLLTNSLVDAELDHRHIRLLEQRRVDGLLVLLVEEDHEPTNVALAGLEQALVVVERDLPTSVRASRILSDHRAGMRAAVRHLLELGHRRIALIVGQPVRPSRERRGALEQEFAAQGLEPTYLVRDGVYSVAHGADATRALLDMPDPPTALIAGGNQIMIGALEIVSERGLELGRDLSLVGCDDIAVAGLYRPPIAVVDRDTVALGAAAAELVLRGIREPGAEPRDVVLPTTFMPRPSCGPAPR